MNGATKNRALTALVFFYLGPFYMIPTFKGWMMQWRKTYKCNSSFLWNCQCLGYRKEGKKGVSWSSQDSYFLPLFSIRRKKPWMTNLIKKNGKRWNLDRILCPLFLSNAPGTVLSTFSSDSRYKKYLYERERKLTQMRLNILDSNDMIQIYTVYSISHLQIFSGVDFVCGGKNVENKHFRTFLFTSVTFPETVLLTFISI
jgi:hypothetical protein